MLYGALEAGGTKMVVAIGDENGTILHQKTIPTQAPHITIPQITDYFTIEHQEPIQALGIGAFGPIDVIKGSTTFGHIMNTPKADWRGFDLYGALKKALFEKGMDIPIGIDTDVNGSCLGEVTYGEARGLDNVVYVTIGTGIGAGIYCEGRLIHGMLHPEGGHILIQKNPKDIGKSVCHCHENCMEGLASGPAIEKRWGKKASELAQNAQVWELESEYIAKGLVNIILLLSPQRIILGGGVMNQEQLFSMVRSKVQKYINGYYKTKELTDMEHYIVPASLAGNQGIMGAIRLAQLAV